jgi:hypothetical protein
MMSMSLWDIESRPWGALIQPLPLQAKRALCRDMVVLSHGYLGSPADRMSLEVQCKQLVNAQADLSAADVLSVMSACYSAVIASEPALPDDATAWRASGTPARLIAVQRSAVEVAAARNA